MEWSCYVPHPDMATIGQVAARAGVSKATVSRVVNGSATVSAPIRHRVEAAVVALGYRPNVTARELALGENRVVALVTSGGGEWPFAQRCAQYLADAALQPVVVELASSHPTRAASAALAHAGAVVALDAAAERRLPQPPAVSTSPGALTVDRVLFDDTSALDAVAASSAERGLSHVALLDDGAMANRDIADLRSVFTKHGLRLLRASRTDDVGAVLSGRRVPKAAIASDPLIAIRSAQQARSAGTLIPHALSLVSIGDSDALAELGIAAVARSEEIVAEQIALAVARHLVDQAPRASRVELRIPSTLVPRSSLG